VTAVGRDPTRLPFNPKNGFCIRRKIPQVPHEGPPHAFVIAESCPLRHLDTRDFLAFEQQPRGFHP